MLLECISFLDDRRTCKVTFVSMIQMCSKPMAAHQSSYPDGAAGEFGPSLHYHITRTSRIFGRSNFPAFGGLVMVVHTHRQWKITSPSHHMCSLAGVRVRITLHSSCFLLVTVMLLVGLSYKSVRWIKSVGYRHT